MVTKELIIEALNSHDYCLSWQNILKHRTCSWKCAWADCSVSFQNGTLACSYAYVLIQLVRGQKDHNFEKENETRENSMAWGKYFMFYTNYVLPLNISASHYPPSF